MAFSTRIRGARTLGFGVVVGFAALIVGAGPALAATTQPFRGTFSGTTMFTACPPGTPNTIVCYTGLEPGAVTSPPAGPATEVDHGFLDEGHPNAAGCIPNYALAVITATNGSGTLYLVDRDFVCGLATGNISEVDGTWQALGGTGVFDDARGSGTYLVSGITVSQTGGAATITYNTGNITTGG
ncbi:MAG: hypothetical protein JO318_15120 [Chloroflexi bacterium]|nr:hypothetical protein [Chloroflexota bacterium]